MSNYSIFSSINSSLVLFLENALAQLRILLQDPDLAAKISLSFGDRASIEEATTLIQNLVNGQQLPELEIVDAATINGGNGAFDAVNNKIYLSEEFVTQNLHNSSAITNVFLEEIGHYLDAQLNDTDTPGDEGAIFAAIAQGQELSPSQLATLQGENDTITAVINGQETTLELNGTYGNITLDGNLGDWTSSERLDFLPGLSQSGYEVYGKIAGDAYVFAIKSDGTAIGAGTTVWLDTDQDASTGYQIFGIAGGAEYNVNFFTDGQPYLYTGAAAENLSAGVLDHAYDATQQIVEFAVPLSRIEDTTPGVNVLMDVNNQVFLPGNYASQKYTIATNEPLPPRTDVSKKVGIVFSQTTADQFFGLPDVEVNRTAYSQLFMSVQEEVMMAGIPFDLLTEADLKDINKLANYDTLIFPSIRNVAQADVQAIQDTLTDAVYQYNIGLVAAGDFMTNDETGAVHGGDPYYRMKTLLGVQPTAFGSGSISLNAQNTAHPAMQGYTSGETIREYQNPIGFAAYESFDPNYPAQVLVDQTVNGQTYNAVVATETGGRNVHFATTSYLGDNNLAWQALRWSASDTEPSVSLSLTRNDSLFLSRNDMDQSQLADNVNPEDGSPGIYDKLLPILNQWKTDFNFVGSYYINVGNSPETGNYTDWAISKAYYEQLLAAGNEIGTHSYTHLEEYAGYNPTNNTNVATPAQLEFEFNQSKQIIEQQLGITVPGAALPGAPELLPTALEIAQYFDYISGGYSSVGAGYPGAFGFLQPGQESVYLAPNLWFDFTLIGFGIPVPDGNGGFVPQPLTAQEAQVEWIRQYNEVIAHANKPIVLMPWHDYGPTNWENNGYTEEMFTALIQEAYSKGAEFATLADASQRIQAFEESQLIIESAGDTITAEVIASGVGNFGLDVTSDRVIQNVDNWYAYDDNTVFLPSNGGKFTINLGTTQDNVTRITELPMRAKLLSLNGNGTNLEYSFSGEGKVVLQVTDSNLVSVIGADSPSINGNTVEMVFNQINQHQARIFTATSGDDVIDGAASQDILVGGAGNDTINGEQAIAQPTTVFVTDFEEAPNFTSGFASAPLDGWNSTDGKIEYWVSNSAEGVNHIELNEDPINFYPDARQIYRDVATEVGKYYELTFQYAPRNGFNAAVNAIAVKLDGNTLLNVAEDGSTNSNLAWKTYTVNFIGDGSTKRLEFLSTGTPVNYGRGGHLDDIKLVAYEADPTLDGNDIIAGGRGNDTLVGGHGNDKFVFVRNSSLLPGELDIIQDFEVGKDKVEFQGWGNVNATSWFTSTISQGLITNTVDGVLLTSNDGGKILFEDINLEKLTSSDFSFS
ncbi:MAG: hypothetical protein Tsb0014_35480 [Pleurocapsa sp.]